MTSFCITGINPKHLNWVEELLTNSGVNKAIASAQNDRITFNLWHEKVLGNKHSSKATAPGRLWDQLASELFLANIESDNWAWADYRSALYLNYWLEFDPSVHFILVYCTPQYFLKTAILTSDKKLSFHELLKDWVQYYQLILNFYSKYSSRCILIDIEETMQYPNEFISALNHKFDTNLIDASLESSTTPEIKSSIEFLINTLLLKQKWVSDFQDKIEPSVKRFGAQKKQPNLPWFAKFKTPFFNYSAHQLTNTLNADLVIEDLRLLCHQDSSKETLSTNILGHSHANQSLLNDEVHQLKNINTDLSQENELLLTQLHQTQEELEKYFFEHKYAEQKLATAQARWGRLLQREPGYFDFESMQVKAEDSNKFKNTRWSFTSLSIGITELAKLELLIKNSDRKPLQVVIKNQGFNDEDSKPELSRPWYPNSASDRDEFILSSTNIRSTDGLSSSDLETLCLIIPLVITLLEAPEYFNLPPELDCPSLTKKLGELNALLIQAKDDLRFDGLTLKNEQINPDYEHLWLALENLSYQGLKVPSFDFRVSSAQVQPNIFGTHPKLEFPAQVESPFLQSWFEESADDFGPKLELRFALPDSMDVGIYRKLSQTDQDFIKALNAKLPLFLDHLASRGTRFSRELDDWKKLCFSTQLIIDNVCSTSDSNTSISEPSVRKSRTKARRKTVTRKSVDRKPRKNAPTPPSFEIIEPPLLAIQNTTDNFINPEEAS